MATVPTSTAFAAVDPFYEQLFRDGCLALDRGEMVGAVEQLRLACFGMLEDEGRLVDCLVRLSLAQAGLDDQDAFLQSLSRILEIERRFGSYSQIVFPPGLKRQFEDRVEQWAPYDAISRVPALRTIADRKLVERLTQLPADERRKELDRRIAVDPSNTQWRWALVEMDFAEGNYPAAAEGADALVSLQPDDDEAKCLRGRARGASRACDPTTVGDLRACAGPNVGPAAETLLRCHVQQESWDEAREVLRAMPADQRRRTSVKRLARQVRRSSDSPPATVDTPVESSVGGSESGARGGAEPGTSAQVFGGSVAAEPVEGAAGATPGEAEKSQLAEGWRVLRGDAREGFESAFASARVLAERYPTWAEAQHLVAELAYRLTLWDDAVTYFRRSGEIVEQKPNLQFYLAVALFKSGDQEGAEAMLDRCEPHIQESDFVRFWTQRIRGAN